MRVTGIELNTTGNTRTLSAQVIWEDCNRPNFEAFFRSRGEDDVFDASNYNAFLIACIGPALHFGERRIHVDGDVCPWLIDNLVTVMAYLNHWHWYQHLEERSRGPVSIEAKSFARPAEPRAPRLGAFFSGGVDSVYTLRRNLMAMPQDHPARIRDAIFVHGFDLRHRRGLGSQEDAFEYFIQEFRPGLQQAQVNLLPVWTNVRQLGPDRLDYWLGKGLGPALASVAHAMSGRLTDCLIASSYHIEALHPLSSHPLIEPRLSSLALRIHHDAERTSRIDKVRSISEWPGALATLRVCFLGKPGRLNCGLCEKCIRTKLELLCAGSLHRTSVFENDELSVRTVIERFQFASGTIPLCRTLVRALSGAGHKDLAVAVAAKGMLYKVKRLASPNVRGLIESVDKNLMGGALKIAFQRAKRRIRDLRRRPPAG